jgi:putative 4-mercaptohistidine N1-methyltranferase
MEPNLYESNRLLAEYLLFHYGSAEQTLGDFPGPVEATGFPVRLVDELLDRSLLEELRKHRPDAGMRALDIGCAVGASTFALSSDFEQVVGIDFSNSFIQAAQRLKVSGLHDAEIVFEGLRTVPFQAMVPSAARRDRVEFEVGDATNLRADLGTFDVVLAANLICRLPDPGKFLARAAELVVPGGQLLLTTPFTWLEDFTPPELWLGGRASGPDSFTELKDALSPHFELSQVKEIPFLLREHRRKFQYTVACGSRWIRR